MLTNVYIKLLNNLIRKTIRRFIESDEIFNEVPTNF